VKAARGSLLLLLAGAASAATVHIGHGILETLALAFFTFANSAPSVAGGSAFLG
jgi:hypothetical protein